MKEKQNRGRGIGGRFLEAMVIWQEKKRGENRLSGISNRLECVL